MFLNWILNCCKQSVERPLRANLAKVDILNDANQAPNQNLYTNLVIKSSSPPLSYPPSKEGYDEEPEPSSYQIKKSYNSKKEFFYVFENLINLEEKEEEVRVIYKKEYNFYFIEDKISQEELKTLDHEYYSVRKIAIFADYNNKINPKNTNDIVISDDQGENLEVKVYKSENICFFKFQKPVPTHVKFFNICLKETGSFKKIKEALVKYVDSYLDPEINSIFLGQCSQNFFDFDREITDYSANGLFNLNESQIKAVKNALNYKVSIIHGPPGTGKTETISSIVYHIDRVCQLDQYDSYLCPHIYNYSISDDIHTGFNKYFNSPSKILVCAASNNPVFDLRRKLTEKGVNVLHILASSKEEQFKNDPETFKYQFDSRVKQNRKLNNLVNKVNCLRNFSNKRHELIEAEKRIELIKREIQRSILEQSSVICCTTRILQNKILEGISFGSAIVDEATQCLEPDIVLCLLKGIRRLILVGDIHQLGPVIKSKAAKDFGFDVTTIERLQDLGVPSTLLDTQYRMQPFLSGFSNSIFYEDRLKDGKISNTPIVFPRIVKTHGFFYHIKSAKEEKSDVSSFINKLEVEAVINFIKYLRSKNIEEKDIGVITFYSGQREYLKRMIDYYRLYDIEIMSVDESQGREKGYIILSCVRSDPSGKIGFLNEYRRLNVAMTRAKHGLVVYGNAKTLSMSNLWVHLVSYFQEHNAIFTGDLRNMRLHRIPLKNTRPFDLKRLIKYSDDADFKIIEIFSE